MANGQSRKGGRANHPMYRNNGRPGPYEQDVEEPSRHNYHSMNAQQMEERRDDEMSRQDEMLDQIYGGVKRLKNHAHAINGEVVEQNEMLDDINDVSSYL